MNDKAVIYLLSWPEEATKLLFQKYRRSTLGLLNKASSTEENGLLSKSQIPEIIHVNKV